MSIRNIDYVSAYYYGKTGKMSLITKSKKYELLREIEIQSWVTKTNKYANFIITSIIYSLEMKNHVILSIYWIVLIFLPKTTYTKVVSDVLYIIKINLI